MTKYDVLVKALKSLSREELEAYTFLQALVLVEVGDKADGVDIHFVCAGEMASHTDLLELGSLVSLKVRKATDAFFAEMN